MKTTVIFLPAVVFTLLALSLLAATSVYASDPTPWPAGLPWGKGTPWPAAAPLGVGQHWSYSAPLPNTAPVLPTPIPTALPLRTMNPAPAVPAAPVPAVPLVIKLAPGTSPDNAFVANGTWQMLAPRASTWYIVGTAVSTGVRMDVWLDASDVSGLDMAIYAPNQLDNLNGPAAGHGTTNKFSPGRLHWNGGGSNAVAGNWYARVSNGSSESIQYKITSEQLQIAPKECHGYWEYFQNGAHVFWTACN